MVVILDITSVDTEGSQSNKRVSNLDNPQSSSLRVFCKDWNIFIITAFYIEI